MATNTWNTPGSHTWTVPDGNSEITIKIWGAGGANGETKGGDMVSGGSGGYAEDTFSASVDPGDQLKIFVGAGGSGLDGGKKGYHNGGDAGGTNAGGGGASSRVVNTTQSLDLLSAGGGGGGGGSTYNVNFGREEFYGGGGGGPGGIGGSGYSYDGNGGSGSNSWGGNGGDSDPNSIDPGKGGGGYSWSSAGTITTGGGNNPGSDATVEIVYTAPKPTAPSNLSATLQ